MVCVQDISNRCASQHTMKVFIYSVQFSPHLIMRFFDQIDTVRRYFDGSALCGRRGTLSAITSTQKYAGWSRVPPQRSTPEGHVIIVLSDVKVK